MTVGQDLDAILADYQRRLVALEDGEAPPPPIDPPPNPGDLVPLADQKAVSRMREGQQIQLVPRIGGWRVDYRTNSGDAVKSAIKPTIAAALASLEPLPSYLKVPSDGHRLSLADQRAVAELGPMTRQGRSCSVRWETNGTHADTNWASPPKKKWVARSLIVEPVTWLRSVW